MSNGGKTFFLNENPYFLLRIWKEREILRQKRPVEKWFLWPWKGKKLRLNVWETTRCPFSKLSWFFDTFFDTLSLLFSLSRNNGMNVVSSVFFGVLSCREFPLPLTIATRVTNSHRVTVLSALHWLEDKKPQRKQNLLRPTRCFWVTLKVRTKCLFLVTSHREVTLSRLSLL